MARLRDIEPYTPWGSYAVDVSWWSIDHWLEAWNEAGGADLDPPFQRGHVWTMEQRSRFIEHCLRRGKSGYDILWNCQDWQHGSSIERHPMVLVDGKQRLTSVRMFINDEVTAFGRHLSEYDGGHDPMEPRFRMHVNDLATEAEVLQWYLDINAGGVVHTDDELDKVRRMLADVKE